MRGGVLVDVLMTISVLALGLSLGAWWYQSFRTRPMMETLASQRDSIYTSFLECQAERDSMAVAMTMEGWRDSSTRMAIGGDTTAFYNVATGRRVP